MTRASSTRHRMMSTTRITQSATRNSVSIVSTATQVEWQMHYHITHYTLLFHTFTYDTRSSLGTKLVFWLSFIEIKNFLDSNEQ
jgi:hypothetical protein